MKILITYARRPPYPPFGEHLVRAFRQTGHDAALLGVRDRPWRAKMLKRLPAPWKQAWQWDHVGWATQRFLKAVARYRPDLILDINGDLCPPDVLQAVKRRWGPRLGAWLVEGPFHDQPYPWLSAYDHIVTTSQVALDQLHRAGLTRAEYLPFGTDPGMFCLPKHPDGSSRQGIGFIGSYAPRRATLLEAVSDLDLRIWGPDWDSQCSSASLHRALRAHGVYGSALVHRYQTSKLFLNVQRERMTTVTADGQRIGTGLNWRHFDVPSCGSLLLSEWLIELPQAFEVGEEIETFASPEELREKARYLLAHDDTRQQMIRRARARVLREHTYVHRAQRWIQWVGRHPTRVSVHRPAVATILLRKKD